MANPKHLEILKQGVDVWNQWREEHPDIKPDLRRALLEGANLREAKLAGAILSGVDLQQADLFGANLEGASLLDTNLQGADLKGANLQGAKLIRANFKNATLTGIKLYGTARDDWIIDGIICDYVYWDYWSRERTPPDRDFRPGEFEELYRSLPTFEYVFEHGFTPIDAVVMDRVVQAINEKFPEFELKLSTLDSRGQPHAVFTVIHKDHLEEAQQQVTTNFEQRLAALEGKQEQMMELFARIADNPKTIELIMGDKRMIQTSRDYLEHVEGDVTTGESTSEPKKEP